MTAKPTSQWLYRHDDRVHGPVSIQDLEAAVRLGFVRFDDLVSRHERHDWKLLMHHAELRAIWEAVDGGPEPGSTREPMTEAD